MLGLGNSLTKSGLVGPTIVTDGLVLKHQYDAGAVVPVSDGSAFLNHSNNDYIDISDDATLDMGTGSFSVACWAMTLSTGTTRFLITKTSSATTSSAVGFSLYLGNSGTDWVFSVGDGTDYEICETTTTQNANQWYHLCGTFNGTSKEQKLYVDGILIETDSDTNIGSIDNSDDFQIGRVAGAAGNDWDGYVCNVGVWKGAVLTQEQVKSIMWKDYAGLTDSEKTNLTSWWNLKALARDSHGTNHGTLS
tara:strand:+ start:1050 stop:1796 length:747 start_codon:yes stop_codon:yes gene_type:complete